ncbi:MAG: sigma-70 family RNA polymerase sigma factor [Minisyncoccia bacterium]
MVSLAQTRLEKEDALTQYLKEITSSKPLPREREAELAKRIQAGDEVARQELAEANLLFVVSVAKQFQNRGLTLAELISAGNLGLMTAVDRFDGQLGNKFITYAVWWIRQAIMKALAEDGRMVRLPLSQLKLVGKIVRAARKLEQESGEVPSLEEIAAELELIVEEVQKVMSNRQSIYSLNNPVWEEKDSMTFLDTMRDESTPPADDRALYQDNYEALERLVDALDKRERKIVRAYYGLNTGSFMNLEEIGDEMNLTRERVRQLKERALRKLHDPAFIARVFKPEESVVR